MPPFRRERVAVQDSEILIDLSQRREQRGDLLTLFEDPSQFRAGIREERLELRLPLTTKALAQMSGELQRIFRHPRIKLNDTSYSDRRVVKSWLEDDGKILVVSVVCVRQLKRMDFPVECRLTWHGPGQKPVKLKFRTRPDWKGVL